MTDDQVMLQQSRQTEGQGDSSLPRPITCYGYRGTINITWNSSSVGIFNLPRGSGICGDNHKVINHVKYKCTSPTVLWHCCEKSKIVIFYEILINISVKFKNMNKMKCKNPLKFVEGDMIIYTFLPLHYSRLSASCPVQRELVDPAEHWCPSTDSSG